MDTQHAAPQIHFDQFIEAATGGILRAMQAHAATALNPQPEPPGAPRDLARLTIGGHWIIGLIYEPQLAPRTLETAAALPAAHG